MYMFIKISMDIPHIVFNEAPKDIDKDVDSMETILARSRNICVGVKTITRNYSSL